MIETSETLKSRLAAEKRSREQMAKDYAAKMGVPVSAVPVAGGTFPHGLGETVAPLAKENGYPSRAAYMRAYRAAKREPKKCPNCGGAL